MTYVSVLHDIIPSVNRYLMANGRDPIRVKGDPRWCDWHVTLTRPTLCWWFNYPKVVSGDQMVPAEVAEVLCCVGAAIPNSVYDTRHSQYWNLPWEHKDG